jgi:hypothetical protein
MRRGEVHPVDADEFGGRVKRGPNAIEIEALRERIRDLSSVHATLGNVEHIGWGNCGCDLAKRLREISEQIQKLMKRSKR